MVCGRPLGTPLTLRHPIPRFCSPRAAPLSMFLQRTKGGGGGGVVMAVACGGGGGKGAQRTVDQQSNLSTSPPHPFSALYPWGLESRIWRVYMFPPPERMPCLPAGALPLAV